MTRCLVNAIWTRTNTYKPTINVPCLQVILLSCIQTGGYLHRRIKYKEKCRAKNIIMHPIATIFLYLRRTSIGSQRFWSRSTTDHFGVVRRYAVRHSILGSFKILPAFQRHQNRRKRTTRLINDHILV